MCDAIIGTTTVMGMCGKAASRVFPFNRTRIFSPWSGTSCRILCARTWWSGPLTGPGRVFDFPNFWIPLLSQPRRLPGTGLTAWYPTKTLTGCAPASIGNNHLAPLGGKPVSPPGWAWSPHSDRAVAHGTPHLKSSLSPCPLLPFPLSRGLDV